MNQVILVLFFLYSPNLMALNCNDILYASNQGEYSSEDVLPGGARKTYSPISLEALERNAFSSNRPIKVYTDLFLGLEARLNTLHGSGGHWIDLGAGNGSAIASHFYSYSKETVTEHELLEKSKLTATGITYSIDSTLQNRHPHIVLPKDNAQLLTGRFFEDIPSYEIGKADIITDYFGVLSYATDFRFNLIKAFRLLKTDGVLYIFNGPLENHQVTTFIDGRKRLNLYQFLLKIPNIQVTAHNLNTPNMGITGFEVSLLPNFKAAEVPRLILLGLEERAPPIRIYRIED